jgi:hypothetical protein
MGFGSKFRALTVVAGAPVFGWALCLFMGKHLARDSSGKSPPTNYGLEDQQKGEIVLDFPYIYVIT